MHLPKDILFKMDQCFGVVQPSLRGVQAFWQSPGNDSFLENKQMPKTWRKGLHQPASFGRVWTNSRVWRGADYWLMINERWSIVGIALGEPMGEKSRYGCGKCYAKERSVCLVAETLREHWEVEGFDGKDEVIRQNDRRSGTKMAQRGSEASGSTGQLGVSTAAERARRSSGVHVHLPWKYRVLTNHEKGRRNAVGLKKAQGKLKG